MANNIKANFLQNMHARYGPLRKLTGSQSLFELVGSSVRIYVRYSAIHGRGTTFYGLREADLQQLDGYSSLICFLWNGQAEPLLIPFADFDEIIRGTNPANDGQYKVQVHLDRDVAELYIAQAGRFNVEGHSGWSALDLMMELVNKADLPELTHSQVQTLLGSIGSRKGYDVWIPNIDRPRLDWSFAIRFECRSFLPSGYERVNAILQEVDVVWINRGSNELSALFEVEHSTPIYSGLLRFNDIHLVAPNLHPKFTVVSNDTRRALFVRQLSRPTFQVSGLRDYCTFLEYANVFEWHKRIFKEISYVGSH